MPANTTANLELSQWAATDYVRREDFNSDNSKIDAALGGLISEEITEIVTSAGASRVTVNLPTINWSRYATVTVEIKLNTSSICSCYLRAQDTTAGSCGWSISPLESSESNTGISVFDGMSTSFAPLPVRITFYPFRTPSAYVTCTTREPGLYPRWGIHYNCPFADLTSLYICPSSSNVTIPAGAVIKIWGNVK